MSPLLTPFILCFPIRWKAQQIIDFYRNFTVELTGVGDVCSFAQMDVRRHGNKQWFTSTVALPTEENSSEVSERRTKSRGGDILKFWTCMMF